MTQIADSQSPYANSNANCMRLVAIEEKAREALAKVEGRES